MHLCTAQSAERERRGWGVEGGGWVALGSVSTKLDQSVGLNERTKQLTTLFIYEGNGIRPDTVPFLHPAC